MGKELLKGRGFKFPQVLSFFLFSFFSVKIHSQRNKVDSVLGSYNIFFSDFVTVNIFTYIRDSSYRQHLRRHSVGVFNDYVDQHLCEYLGEIKNLASPF